LPIKWAPGRVISGYTFNQEDINMAKLKLAIVKRNFNFIDFYEKLSKDPYSIISEFQSQAEPRDAYLKRLGELYGQEGPFFGGRHEEFGFFEYFIAYAQEYWSIPTSEILSLLNPQKNLGNLNPVFGRGLPLLFYSPEIEEFGLAYGMVVDMLGGKLCYRRYKPEIWGYVERYERILKIDLREKSTQLVQELKAFLEYEREYLKAGKKFEPLMEKEFEIDKNKVDSKFFDYDIDDIRQRKETWKQLLVWDLRRKKEIVRTRGTGSVFTIRTTFGRISNMLKIPEDLVKKRFYRAYEITQGRKYDIEKNRELWEIRQSELKKECGACEIKDTCKDPCPDVLPFIEQDRVGPGLDQPLIEEKDSDQDSDEESVVEPNLDLDKIKD
jgi:hypothetical protein